MAEAVKADALLATDSVHVDSWVLGFVGLDFRGSERVNPSLPPKMSWESQVCMYGLGGLSKVLFVSSSLLDPGSLFVDRRW